MSFEQSPNSDSKRTYITLLEDTPEQEKAEKAAAAAAAAEQAGGAERSPPPRQRPGAARASASDNIVNAFAGMSPATRRMMLVRMGQLATAGGERRQRARNADAGDDVD